MAKKLSPTFLHTLSPKISRGSLMRNSPITKAECFSDPPQVHLQLGSTLNPVGIKEGDDVYFECNIKSNPKEHKITWHHNVSTFFIFMNCQFLLKCCQLRNCYVVIAGINNDCFVSVQVSRPPCQLQIMHNTNCIKL